MKHRSWLHGFLLTGMFCLILQAALTPVPAAKDTPAIPDDLKPWKDWVLHGQDAQVYGIPDYNNAKRLHCEWPTALTVDADADGARFTQEWRIDCESWVRLPGSDPVWPLDVRVDGTSAIKVKRGTYAAVKLDRGDHRITGRLTWPELPEYLTVPGETAFVSLTVNGDTVAFPKLDDTGRLWFQVQRSVEETIENRLTVQAYRLIRDELPPTVTTFLRLEVAGAARETVLGPVFDPDAFVPVALESGLPTRIEADGRLTLQLRPGVWTVSVTARHLGPLTELTFQHPDDGFWPDQSIYTFQAHPNLRIVEITGVPSIDPQQTRLPDAWRQYPAYRMTPGDTMVFTELKRGDPDPAPDQLTLNRKIWLRFDGSGYTIQDRITGQKNNEWRLEMNPPIKLGKVEVDGAIQFITRRDDSGKHGVELRRGAVNLTADSEYGNGTAVLPLTGWDQAFQSVSTDLVLPPGYRLIHAFGIDNVPDTWITRWNLLDLFFVLLFTAAVSKLYSRKAAILAFFTLGLLVHEPGAPVWIWLAVIIGAALLKYLPDGWFKTVVKIYQIGVIVILAAIAVVFAVNHVRNGLYPQLERDGRPPTMGDFMTMGAAAPAPVAVPELDRLALKEAEVKGTIDSPDSFQQMYQARKTPSRSRYSSVSNVAQYDPRMLNQTGPGLPDWQWHSIHMRTGPTEPGQTLTLILTGPVINRLLAFVRVALLILLGFTILGATYNRRSGWSAPGLRKLAIHLAAVAVLSTALLTSGIARAESPPAQELPSQSLLDELQKRLLEADDCFPHCADVAEMTIRLDRENLRMTMEFHAVVDTAVPLPGDGKHWLPGRAVLDGRTAPALFRTRGMLWAMIPSGIHRLELSGPLPAFATVQVPLPMKPGTVTVDADGWTVEGIRENGAVENHLQFTRLLTEEQAAMPAMGANVLPPFVRVNRMLMLGLDWRVLTTVSRVSPRDGAIVLDIPLLPGESVTTEGIEIQDGMARISLDASASQLQWESMLEPADTIVLTHAETTAWSETWEVEVSPILHMAYDGIPVVMRQQADRWLPVWRPWPGETLSLAISRPEGVPGQTLTVQRSDLKVNPGKRVTDCHLTLTVQSSQGMQHTIRVPEGARVQEITVNGQSQPIRQEGREIPLAITPGVQTIEVKWRENRGTETVYRTSDIDLGIRSVNSNITVSFPTNRWLLWLSGPQMGPAVLFWTYLIVIILAALILNRTGWTPLKFRHWFLLGLGMTQGGLAVILLVVGWLVAMHFRGKMTRKLHPVIYDALQIAFIFFTIVAMIALIVAISSGLLGRPDMSIAGNGSSAGYLKWYQDSVDKTLPAAMIVSIPLFFYRIAMLLWALWIAFYMITIFKWCWKQVTEPVFWHTGK